MATYSFKKICRKANLIPMIDWSPVQYLQFADQRSRPARDLLAHVPLNNPKRVVDIGCGPGNSTELLLERFAETEIVGIDSSPEMIDAARKRLPSVNFHVQDVSSWQPEADVDLLYSNATFQWIPDHLNVMARLFEALGLGAVLAVQIPDNLAEPSHELMRKLSQEAPWASKFAEPIVREQILPITAYYERLKPMASYFDIWHTIYHHHLTGVDKICEMVKSTGMRPYLSRLTQDEQAEWFDRYTASLKEAYPSLVNGGVLFSFPRLFMIAVRSKKS